MVDGVLAPASPLLDAAEAALADATPQANRGVHHTILAAIATGERSFSGIARVAGVPTGALSRPLATLERAGLITRVPDPLRSRRDSYDLADPQLRMWLAVIGPHRSALQAGRGRQVWRRVRATTWRAAVLGPRWESVVRDHVARVADRLLGGADLVGATTIADRSERTSREVDIVAVRGREVVAVGEAKLRAMGMSDLDRLRRVRDLLGAPDARMIVASADAVDPEVPDGTTCWR
jgi:uncharacterized protein